MARPAEKDPKYKHPEYSCYRAAKYRCTNPAAKSYASYGGRGIEFRFNSYEQFISCVGRRPGSDYSIDRINNDGHYEPGNVQWALRLRQANNTRLNKQIFFQGESKTLSEWARERNIKSNTLLYRIRRGWPIERALGFSSAP